MKINASNYTDFKTVVANFTDPADIYYSNTGSFFVAVFVDRAGRMLVQFAVPVGSAPSSFTTDFPSAQQMTSAITFAGSAVDINL